MEGIRIHCHQAQASKTNLKLIQPIGNFHNSNDKTNTESIYLLKGPMGAPKSALDTFLIICFNFIGISGSMFSLSLKTFEILVEVGCISMILSDNNTLMIMDNQRLRQLDKLSGHWHLIQRITLENMLLIFFCLGLALCLVPGRGLFQSEWLFEFVSV